MGALPAEQRTVVLEGEGGATSSSKMAKNVKPDLDEWIALLRDCQCLPEAHVKIICDQAREVLQEEQSVQPVRIPVR